MAIIEDSTAGNTLEISDDSSAKVNLGGRVSTYSAVVQGVASAATPTDIFTITGSATATIKVWQIQIEATETVAATGNILLIKRSTANQSGTSATATNVPYDSSNAAATATVRSYTANPGTLGTTVGNVYAYTYYYQATGAKPDLLNIEFGKSLLGQPVTLRGTSEVLAVNLAGVTVTGGSYNFLIVWSEE